MYQQPCAKFKCSD